MSVLGSVLLSFGKVDLKLVTLSTGDDVLLIGGERVTQKEAEMIARCLIDYALNGTIDLTHSKGSHRPTSATSSVEIDPAV